MKRKLLLLVMIITIISVSFACSNGSAEDAELSKCSVSGEMDYECLVQYYAETHEVTADAAKKAINQMRILKAGSDELKEARYRVLTIPLQVDCKYKPALELYAETFGDDEDWEISKIKCAAFVGAVNGQSWRFAGDVAFWLREDKQVEYDVNGDFGQNSRALVNIGIDIADDGSNGVITYKIDEEAGALKNTAYCSQHEWVAYHE